MPELADASGTGTSEPTNAVSRGRVSAEPKRFSMAIRPLKVSINRSLVDKEEPADKRAYSHDWEAFELGIEELGAAVQKTRTCWPRPSKQNWLALRCVDAE
jgi:hypothetical protein